MTQNDQTGFLKKNRFPKNSVLIMASFSLVLGCGLQKSQSNNAPKSEVKNEKSIEEEVKEQSTTNQQKKSDKEVTKDQLVSFALSKGLLPKNTDTTAVKVADLSRFAGKEDQCAFFELASSYVCVENDTLFADSAIGGVEWHVRPPKRVHLPDVSDIIPTPNFSWAINEIAKPIANELSDRARNGGWTTATCGIVAGGTVTAISVGYSAAICAAASVGAPLCVAFLSNAGTAITVATCAQLCTDKKLADCQ